VPLPWLAVAVGVGPVPFSRGREQPFGALPLPTRPGVAEALAPDRRSGLTIDGDLGVARAAVGIYQGARRLDLDALGGVLLTGRLVVEPIGPVGRGAWPRVESGPWAGRPRIAVGLSAALRGQAAGDGWAIGADLAVRYRRLLVDGEFLYARAWPLERPDAIAPDAIVAPTALPQRMGAWLEQVVRVWRDFLAVALREEYLDEGGGRRALALVPGATLELPARLRLGSQLLVRMPLASAQGPNAALLFDLTLER
jgi:hypothetical protein